jgi:putative inorganic carbon (HCO3(-)) transporter
MAAGSERPKVHYPVVIGLASATACGLSFGARHTLLHPYHPTKAGSRKPRSDNIERKIPAFAPRRPGTRKGFQRTRNRRISMKVIPAPSDLEKSNLPFPKHVASLVLQTGIIVCVLALLPRGLLEISLCNSPKELALQFFGLTAACLCLTAARRLTIDWTDLLFGAFLLLSIVSGSFATSDRWEALRAVGVTLSGAAVFWSSRDLASNNQRRPLLNGASFAVILVAVGVLLDAFTQGYGVSFAKPAGTQGNRNWAGHLLALGMPLLAFQWAYRDSAKRIASRVRLPLAHHMFSEPFLPQPAGNLLVLVASSAALVLTRSRAAWIAALLGTGFPLVISAAMSRRSRASTIRQVAASVCGLVIGVFVGVYSPTRLDWKSPHPYIGTVRSLLAYDRGSGYGRIVQYRHSLAMAIDHPTLGVGPGNWKILYPAYSIGIQPPVVAPIWEVPSRPNSDLIGFIAERGVPATVVLLAALVSLAVGHVRSLTRLGHSTDYDEKSYCALASLGILIALAVVGSLDAVLQLPAPTYLVFLSLGALAPQGEIVASLRLSSARRVFLVVTILLLAAILMALTLDEIVAASLIARGRPDDLAIASRISVDPRWFVNEWEWSRRAGLGCL